MIVALTSHFLTILIDYEITHPAPFHLSNLFARNFLQVMLILPFLLSFSVEEVWYVLDLPDPLARSLITEADKLRIVINCLPSMHTSLSVASIMLAWRDKDIWFPIHWTIDLFFGVGLGVVSVKLTDTLFNRFK